MCQHCGKDIFHGRETIDSATMDSTVVLDVKEFTSEDLLKKLENFPRNKKLVVPNFRRASQEVRTALMELSDAGIARVYMDTCPLKA